MYVEFLKGKKFPGNKPNTSDFIESFDDAGYIIEDLDIIVDIDNGNHEFCRKIIENFNITTKTVWTDRGVHLYFAKTKERIGKKTGICALGIPIELKNKTNKYITVKRNGVARKVENEDVIMDFPDLFEIKNYEDLSNLDDGDGRNNALFKQWKKLQTNVVDDRQKIIKFIAKYVFQSPLPDKEVDTILKNEDITKDVALDEEQQLDATRIIKNYKCVKYQSTLFFKNGENYSCDEDEFNFMLSNYILNNKTAMYIDQVKRLIMMKTKTIHQDDLFVKFNNGILKDGEFIDVITDDFTPYKINIDYKPNAKKIEHVDEYLNNLCNNEENYIKHVLEAIATSFILDTELKRHLATFWMFYGDGGNGKGTLLTIIRKILGNDNCSSVDIFDLKDDKKIGSLTGMLANLGDDIIAKKAIDDATMKRLKNITTADSIEFRPIYSQPKKAILSPTLIFTTNRIIKTWEKGGAVKRRIMWCPMLYKPLKKDPKFISKLTSKEALEYWLKLLVEAYQRLIENKKYTQSDTINQFTDEYHKENDPLENFIEELDLDEDIIGKTLDDFKDLYRDFTDDPEGSFPKRRLSTSILAKFENLEYKVSRITGKNGKRFIRTFQVKE